MPEEKLSPEENRPIKKRYRFWIILLIGFCVFCGGVYILWLLLQEPARGEIRVKKGTVQENIDQTKKEKEYQGEYLTFLYPDSYVEKMHEVSTEGPTRERIFLSVADLEGRKIAVTVEEREEKRFEASPSFQMRVNASKTYERSSLEQGEETGVLFTKNSSVFEQTAFFQKNGFILGISVTSPFSLDALREDLQSVLQSLVWKTQE